jgi:hypothetical protein
MNCSHTTHCATCAPIVASLIAERDAAIKERDAAIRERDAERDAALAILRDFVGAEETAKTSSTKSLGQYVDAIDRARKLLGQP